MPTPELLPHSYLSYMSTSSDKAKFTYWSNCFVFFFLENWYILTDFLKIIIMDLLVVFNNGETGQCYCAARILTFIHLQPITRVTGSTTSDFTSLDQIFTTMNMTVPEI